MTFKALRKCASEASLHNIQLQLKALNSPTTEKLQKIKTNQSNQWGQRWCVHLIPLTISQVELKPEKDESSILTCNSCCCCAYMCPRRLNSKLRLEATPSYTIVCWKSIQRSGLHFIYVNNSAFL